MEPMTQAAHFSLSSVGLVVGVIIAGSHIAGLLVATPAITAAIDFPRSRFWGSALLAIAVIWTLGIAATTDLGEFSPMRHLIVIGVAAGGILTWRFVPDFLSSRSLGFLLLLAAHPVLESTFLQHGILKLLLAILAYGWALAGLFLVGMPYLHRDLIGWVCAERWRWNAACWAGLIYGAVLIVVSLLG
ncbi:MAG: hypothetical protein EBR40_05215 [Proteobacteria bacterium]|nr:hypothetical protein [Pseudomonadota bacterium]